MNRVLGHNYDLNIFHKIYLVGLCIILEVMCEYQKCCAIIIVPFLFWFEALACDTKFSFSQIREIPCSINKSSCDL